jgi:hypothetical protein
MAIDPAAGKSSSIKSITIRFMVSPLKTQISDIASLQKFIAIVLPRKRNSHRDDLSRHPQFLAAQRAQ